MCYVCCYAIQQLNKSTYQSLADAPRDAKSLESAEGFRSCAGYTISTTCYVSTID